MLLFSPEIIILIFHCSFIEKLKKLKQKQIIQGMTEKSEHRRRQSLGDLLINDRAFSLNK